MKFLPIILSLLTWTLPMSSGSSPLSDRLPPQNLSAEQGVLGGMLLDPETIHEVVAILRPDDFYRDSHQAIYRAIHDLYDQGKPTDGISVTEELERRGQFSQVGGIEAMAELLGSVPHAANVAYHAGIVREKAVWRSLMASAEETLREGYSNSLNAEEGVSLAQRRAMAIDERLAGSGNVEASTFALEGMQLIAARQDGTGMGVPSGIDGIDRLLCGLQPEYMIVLAGRPSMGKSALALAIADHVAIDQDVSTLYISLEMGSQMLGARMLVGRAGVNGGCINGSYTLSTHESCLLGQAYEQIKQSKLVIDGHPVHSPSQIMANARKHKQKYGLGLLIVDYIQLIDPDESGRDSRQEQIAKISRRLKTLALDLKIPVLALSQLNRAVEATADKEPMMSHLRESGAIEQDADAVLLMHRPDYYDENAPRGLTVVNVAKHRNGPIGKVKLNFDRDRQRFTPWQDSTGYDSYGEEV